MSFIKAQSAILNPAWVLFCKENLIYIRGMILVLGDLSTLTTALGGWEREKREEVRDKEKGIGMRDKGEKEREMRDERGEGKGDWKN